MKKNILILTTILLINQGCVTHNTSVDKDLTTIFSDNYMSNWSDALVREFAILYNVALLFYNHKTRWPQSKEELELFYQQNEQQIVEELCIILKQIKIDPDHLFNLSNYESINFQPVGEDKLKAIVVFKSGYLEDPFSKTMKLIANNKTIIPVGYDIDFEIPKVEEGESIYNPKVTIKILSNP